MANMGRWLGSFLPRRKTELKVKQTTKQEQQAQAQSRPAPPASPEVQTVLIDSYPVLEPFVRIAISLEPDGSKRYIVIEPTLTKAERKTFDQIKEILKAGLNVDAGNLKPEENDRYLTRETLLTLKKFGLKVNRATFDKLFYYLKRDFLGYAKIDPLMRDPQIEDISCNGPRTPVFTFHRSHESIPTNVLFKDEEELDKFIMRLAYMSGRHISVAEPVVDASLPDGSRLQMTFGSEVTKKGSTFTIRKFREDPYSIVDLIKFGTINADVAGVMWFALENKGSALMAGGTASGKTTTINCLALFIRPEAKIVTIEDTPEINLAHTNWIESVSRPGMGGMGDVSLYDLLKAALRQRPDFIVVGEVRGEEASTMFQALSTGHAGMSSIHADSIPAVFHRLTNPPMSIPKTLIPALNFVLLQGRLNIGGKPVRRMLSVTEVVGLDTRTNEIITNELFRYNPEEDSFVFTGRSYILEKFAKLRGISVEEAKQEIATRKVVVQWMVERNLRRYRDVAGVVQRYYTDKAGLLAQVGGITA